MVDLQDRKKAYICCMVRGDVQSNLEKCRRYCRIAYDMGFIPVAPHLFYTQFLDDSKPEERDFGMAAGLMEIDKCDELWVIGEVSSGMRNEIAYAKSIGKTVREIDLKVYDGFF